MASFAEGEEALTAEVEETVALEGEDGDEVREQDRFLPIANISRIMKKSLPPNAKIAKDAKETVQECVSELFRLSRAKPAISASGKRERRLTATTCYGR